MLLRFGFIRPMLLLWFIHNQARLFIDEEIVFLSNSFDRLIKFSCFDLLLQILIESHVGERHVQKVQEFKKAGKNCSFAKVW